jgi:hypothetical protein
VRSYDLTGQRSYRPPKVPRTMLEVDFTRLAAANDAWHTADTYEQVSNRFNTSGQSVQGPDSKIRWDDNTGVIKTGHPVLIDFKWLHAPFWSWLAREAQAQLWTVPNRTTTELVEYQVFGTEASRGYLREGRAELSARADWLTRQLEAENYATYDNLLSEQVQQLENLVTGAADAPTAIGNMLGRFPGFIIGEDHKETETWPFVYRHLDDLYSNGVRVIYVEHVMQSLQPLLDEYFDSPTDADIPWLLAQYLTSYEQHYGHDEFTPSLRQVLDKAKHKRIRVVGIDHALAHEDGLGLGYLQSVNARISWMNAFAHGIITGQSHHGARDKFVVVVGQDHAHTVNYVNIPLPGLSQLLNVPAVRITSKNPSGMRLLVEYTPLRVRGMPA